MLRSFTNDISRRSPFESCHKRDTMAGSRSILPFISVLHTAFVFACDKRDALDRSSQHVFVQFAPSDNQVNKLHFEQLISLASSTCDIPATSFVS